jgi:hypothetical protein
MSEQQQDQLVNNAGAARALGVSRSFLYRLKPGTPGVYYLGRSVRYSVVQLRGWAAMQAKAGGANGQ